MSQNPEEIIRKVYWLWRKQFHSKSDSHPSEEEFSCFFKGSLAKEDEEKFKAHLVRCERCLEITALNDSIVEEFNSQVPQDLIDKAKGLVKEEDSRSILNIFLRFKDNSIELIKTCGDVLVGQELIPSAVLRSRKISEFKNQVTVLKDFEDLRVEVKTENINGKTFNLEAVLKNKKDFNLIDDLRVTLLKDDIEMESYLSVKGKVFFEDLHCGIYQLKIYGIENQLALISLEIKN